MGLFNVRDTRSEVSVVEDKEALFPKQDMLDKYDKILGDDKLGLEGDEVEKGAELIKGQGVFGDQELWSRYDKLLEDDNVGLEGNEVEKIDELHEKQEDFSDQELLSSYDKILGDDKLEDEIPEHTYTGLTEEEGNRVKEEKNWSDEIIVFMGSWEEYEIYKGADLEEQEIAGKLCLIRSDIDWEKQWETGKYDENGDPIFETNEDRILKGRAPLDSNGNPIQLHHIGQHADSPLAELTFEEHRCNGNDTILHDKSIETEAHAEGNNWDRERQDYWMHRADYNEGGSDNG